MIAEGCLDLNHLFVCCKVAQNTVRTVQLSTWAAWEVRAAHLGYRFAKDCNVMVGSSLSADNAFGEELSISAEPTPRIWFHFRVSLGFCSFVRKRKVGSGVTASVAQPECQPWFIQTLKTVFYETVSLEALIWITFGARASHTLVTDYH
jgi:hypothetical protein